MAEVYVIGQIVGASGFPKKSLFCKWGIQTGGGWRVVTGITEGQTQVDDPVYDSVTCWCHPVDVHFATKGIQGWPKLHVQVYHYDNFGRSEIYGYGFTHIPTTPGLHKIECLTWRPIGTLKEEFMRYFLGGGPQLKVPDLVFSGTDRYKLHTQTMGIVHLELNIVLRNFEKFGIKTYTFSGIVSKTTIKPHLKSLKPTAVADIKLPKTIVSTLSESPTNTCENDTAEICEQTTESFENVTLLESSGFTEISKSTNILPVLPNVTFPTNTTKTISGTVNMTSTDSPKQTNETNLVDLTVPVNTTKTTDNLNLEFFLVSEADCDCDLIKNVCDINCCCDRNCTAEDRAVFSHCIKTQEHLSSHHCVSKYMIYLNNTQYQVMEDQVSLFCIVVDNMPVKFEYLKHLALKSVNDFIKLWRRYMYYDWNLNVPDIKSYKTNEVYKTGTELLVVKDASLVPLALPTQVFSSLCQGEVGIMYLKDFNSSCLRQIPKSEAECQQLNPILPDQIISSPTLLNMSQLDNCSEEVCLPVKKFLCFGSENNEKCEEQNITFSVFNSSTQSCNSLIKSLHYVIQHNGTQGITFIKALIRVFNTFTKNESVFRQFFQVTFEWLRPDNETGFQKSGHPGYLVGRPIISGIRNYKMDNELENKTLEMSESPKDWLSVSTANDDGSCDGHKRVNIMFGYNLQSECTLKVVGDCQHKQAMIWQQLMGRKINKTENIYISSYGDPNVNNLDDWVLLLQDILFESSQLVTQIKIKIISTSVGSASNPQTQILGAHLEPLSIDCQNTNKSQVVSLTSSVTFVDITKPPLTIFAQPPVFEIKLPKDFFYPFLSESPVNNTPTFYLILLHLVIVFIFQ